MRYLEKNHYGNNSKTAFAFFDGVQELYSEKVEPFMKGKQFNFQHPDKWEGDLSNADWVFGTKDKEECKDRLEKLLRGEVPQSYIDRIEKVLPKVKQFGAGQVKRRRKRRNEFDGDFDLDAVMAGDPRFYSKVTKVNRMQKTTSIIINVSASAMVTAREIQEKMTQVISNVIAIAQTGATIDVTVVAGAAVSIDRDNNNNRVWVGYKLHSAGERFTPEKLYPLLTSYILRTAIFRGYIVGTAKMQGREDNKEVDTCLGQPMTTALNEGFLEEDIKTLAEYLKTDFQYYDMHTEQGKEGINPLKQ